ncbi:MAG TPA: hypothetical protein VI259_10915 [Gemmatimonadaceae bacterium]
MTSVDDKLAAAENALAVEQADRIAQLEAEVKRLSTQRTECAGNVHVFRGEYSHNRTCICGRATMRR